MEESVGGESAAEDSLPIAEPPGQDLLAWLLPTPLRAVTILQASSQLAVQVGKGFILLEPHAVSQ